MSLPTVFAWIIAAILITWFVASCFYDIRSHRQQKRIARLEKDLALVEFKLERHKAVKAEFEKECG